MVEKFRIEVAGWQKEACRNRSRGMSPANHIWFFHRKVEVLSGATCIGHSTIAEAYRSKRSTGLLRLRSVQLESSSYDKRQLYLERT